MLRMRWLLLVALVVRLFIPLGAYAVHGNPQVFVQPDTNSYVQPARMLLERGRFESPGGRPEIQRTPGYPLLLTLGVFTGRLTATTIIVQILLGVGTVFGVALLARRWSWQVAQWAAVFYALDPLSVLYPSTLMAETLFAAVFVAHLCALAHVLDTPRSVAWPVAAGVLAAASTFVRPIAYFWPFVAAAILMYVLRRGGVRACAVFLIVALLPCALWQARNFERTGYPGFSTIGARNLYSYNAAGVLARVENVPIETVRARLRTEVEPLDLARRNEHMRAGAVRIITEQPLTYLVVHLGGMVRVIAGPGFAEWVRLYSGQHGAGLALPADQRNRPSVPTGYLALGVILAMQLGFAALGIRRFWSRRAAVGWILIGAAAYFLLLSGGPAGYSRFRHPMMPAICVFAAVGVSRFATAPTVRGTPPVRSPHGARG